MTTKEELQPLFNFCSNHGVGDFEKDPDTQQPLFLFLEEHFHKLGLMGVLFKGSEGGLISGLEENPKGGIWCIKPWKNNTYRLDCRVLTGSYVSHYATYPHFKNEFEDMESGNIEKFLKYKSRPLEIPENCKIIDTQEKRVSFIFLSQYTQFIFSNSTVNNHLNRIVEIEDSFSFDI